MAYTVFTDRQVGLRRHHARKERIEDLKQAVKAADAGEFATEAEVDRTFAVLTGAAPQCAAECIALTTPATATPPPEARRYSSRP